MPTKPKCGKGQSCGDSCISAADTCKDTLSDDSVILLLSLSKATGGPANIKGAYAAAASQSAASSARTSNFVNPGDRDLSFDQLQAKYPMKAGVANDQVDLGNGWSRWDISHRASDGSGDIMSYSVLQAPAVSTLCKAMGLTLSRKSLTAASRPTGKRAGTQHCAKLPLRTQT